jgi:hypothetical protein
MEPRLEPVRILVTRTRPPIAGGFGQSRAQLSRRLPHDVAYLALVRATPSLARILLSRGQPRR